MRGDTLSRVGALAFACLTWTGCFLQEDAAPPPLAPPDAVYVANESSGTVSIIDARAMRVVGTVELGRPGTHDLALSRDGKTLFATSLATGLLSVIDTATGKVEGSVLTGNRCHSVALTNDERQIWVVNIGDNNIAIVDTGSLRILGRIPVGREPGHIRFTKDGLHAFVTLQAEGSVEVIEVGTHRSVAKIPVGRTPHYLLPSPDGRHMWGGATGEDHVYVIDTESRQRVATLKVGARPQHLTFAFRGMQGPLAYVVAETPNEVVVVTADPRDLKVLDTIRVGAAPGGVGADRAGTRLFVSNAQDGTVTVIDTGTGRVLGHIPVGLKPVGVVVSY